MKTSISIFLIFLFSSAYSQELTGARTLHIPSIDSKTSSISKQVHSPTSALEQLTLKYYDETLPTIEWIGEGQYGPYLLYWIGERMTLPSETGFLDSVSIQIDSLPTDSLFVSIIQDSLYDIGGGTQYRLINIFRTGTILAVANIYPQDISRSHPVTIKFPHVPIPKEFFVVVSSATNQNGQPTNYFFIRGDNKPPRERTADGSRSAGVFIDLQTGNTISAILDGTFILNGQSSAAFSDMYITAYVESTAASAPHTSKHTPSISVFPNPSTNVITVTTAYPHAMIRIFDALGRAIFTTDCHSTKTQIDVSSISNGFYTLIVESADAINRTTLSIVR